MRRLRAGISNRKATSTRWAVTHSDFELFPNDGSGTLAFAASFDGGGTWEGQT